MAVRVTTVSLDWAAVVTVNEAVVLPVATVTEGGTDAAAAFELDSATTLPLPIAGLSRVTVPVADAPPISDTGLTDAAPPLSHTPPRTYTLCESVLGS